MKSKILTFLALLTFGLTVSAQWTEPVPNASSLILDDTVYFYNAGAKQFLNVGNAWGAQASISNTGLECVISKYFVDGDWDNSTYLIRDEFPGQGIRYSFINDNTCVYMDLRNITSSVNAYYNFTKNGQYYRISGSDINPYYTPERFPNKYLGVLVDREETDSIVYPLLTEREGYVDWIIVNRSDYNNYFEYKKAYDASLLLWEQIEIAQNEGIDVSDELEVYENTSSTEAELLAAKESVEEKIENNAYDLADVVVDGLYYCQYEGTAGYILCGTETMFGYVSSFSPTRVDIPDSIYNDDYNRSFPVVAIESYAFQECNLLKEITIPSTISYMEPCILEGCCSLETVTWIPNEGIDEDLNSGNSSWMDVFYGVPSTAVLRLADDSENTNAVSSLIKYMDQYFATIELLTYDSASGLLFKQNASNNQYTLVDYTAQVPADLTVPCSISAGRATAIEARAFEECPYIKNVTLESSYYNIGNDAFAACPNLRSVTLSKGLRKINSNLFKDCPLLKTVVISDKVTSIGSGAFRYCTSLMHVNIPEGVTEIKDYTFQGCSALEGIDLHDGITTIGKAAFTDCVVLAEVHMPSSVVTIDSKAFYNCKNLTSMRIPESVETLGANFIYATGKFYDVHIYPNSSLTYTASSFSGCTSKTLHIISTAVAAGVYPDYVQTLANFAKKYFKTVIIEDAEPFELAVNSSMFTSLYLDHPVLIPTGILGVFYARHLSEETLRLTRISGSIPAYTPVIIFANPGYYNFSTTVYDKYYSANVLQGVLESVPVEFVKANSPDANVLTLQPATDGVGFKLEATDEEYLEANTVFYLSTNPEVKRMNIAFDDENDATAIGRILSAKEGYASDDSYYTIQGVKVEKPSVSGIYIRNGKKVYLKF